MPKVTVRTVDGEPYLVIDGALVGRDATVNLSAGGVADLAAACGRLGMTTAAQLLADPANAASGLHERLSRGSGVMNFEALLVPMTRVDDA